jgi:hypothetical protein
MAAVTGTLGGQPIVLDNAATEDTLKQLLAVMRNQAKSSGGGAGGSGALGGAKNLGVLGKESGDAGKAMNMFNKAVGKGGDALVKMAGEKVPVYVKALMFAAETVGALTGAFAKLTTQAYNGDVAMSDVFKSLEGLPGPLGDLAKVAGDLVKIQEENMRAFRSMAKTGVGFEGSLTTVRTSALALGLTVDQFAAVMSANTDVFRMLGGDVETGAKQFVQFGKVLRDSQAGSNLRALGMSAADTQEAMSAYIRNSGGLTEKQKKDYAGVAESVATYAKETDLLAKLTGQSSKSIEDNMKHQAADQAWQATLLGMDEKQREAATQALKVAFATGGQGAVDVLKAKMAGLPVMSEAGQNFVSMSGNASKRMEEMDAVIKSNMSAEQKRQKLEELGAKLQLDRARDAEKIGLTTLKAMAASGDTNAVAMLEASNNMKKAGITTYEGAVENLKKAGASQDAQMKSQASAMADAENSLKNLGKVIDIFVAPLLNVLTPMMTKAVSGFANFVSGPVMTHLLDFLVVVEELCDGVANFFGEVFSKAGILKIINNIEKFFAGLWIDIKRGLAASLGKAGDLIYSEADAKRDREGLDARAKAEDDRLTAVGKLRDKEEEFEKAKLALSDTAMKEQRDSVNKKQAELKALNDTDTKNMTALQQMQLDQKKAVLQKELDSQKQSLADAQEMRKSGKAAKLDAERKALEAQAQEDSKGNKLAPANPTNDDQPNSPPMDGGGDLARGKTAMVGENGPELVKGPASVTSRQDTKSLIDGQNAVVAALNMLNMQTAKLIALNAEQEKHQKIMSNKLAWTGNLFE